MKSGPCRGWERWGVRRQRSQEEKRPPWAQDTQRRWREGRWEGSSKPKPCKLLSQSLPSFPLFGPSPQRRGPATGNPRAAAAEQRLSQNPSMPGSLSRLPVHARFLAHCSAKRLISRICSKMGESEREVRLTLSSLPPLSPAVGPPDHCL